MDEDMDLLSDEAIEVKLGELDGWSREGDVIVKTFERGDFVGSVKFVDSLVEPAEGMGHHPDLELSWDKVKVTITNHAEGGLTENDLSWPARSTPWAEGGPKPANAAATLSASPMAEDDPPRSTKLH